MWAGAHKDIGVKAAAGEDLRQRPGVTERVHTIGDGRLDAQVTANSALAQQHLAHQRLPAWQIHVRLDDHAVDYMPASGGDQALDLSKHSPVLLFDPGVNLRLATREVKVRVLGKTVNGGLAGSQRLGATFCPAPQPHGVKVRLADHVNNGFGYFWHRSKPVCGQAGPAALAGAVG